MPVLFLKYPIIPTPMEYRFFSFTGYPGISEVFEKFGIRFKENRRLSFNKFFISLKSSEKRVKLRILLIGRGVDICGTAIPFAEKFHLLLIGFGKDNLFLLVGFSLDLSRSLLSLGPISFRNPVTFCLHTSIDTGLDLFGQVSPFDPHIDDLDAKSFCLLMGVFCHGFDDLLPLFSNEPDKRVFGTLLPQPGNQDILKSCERPRLR